MSHGEELAENLGAEGMGVLFDFMQAGREFDDQLRQSLIDSQESMINGMREAVALAQYYLSLGESWAVRKAEMILATIYVPDDVMTEVMKTQRQWTEWEDA